ncbi:S1 family peptidase [Allokutzneria oryzae]|uniref:S1 family peptidase n=1 Tax=Allokutzneria oryzae TaxID=1378989 RepID=A0ABV5ZZ47_9PSEU
MFGRRLMVLVSVLALSPVSGAVAAPSTVDTLFSSQAKELPADLIDAVRRDLGIDAPTYLEQAWRASGRPESPLERPLRTLLPSRGIAAGMGLRLTDASRAPAGLCTLGFLAVDGKGRSTPLTAGHCAALTRAENASLEQGGVVGRFDTVRFDDLGSGGKGEDYATLRVTNPWLRPAAEVIDQRGGRVPVEGVVAPVEGMPVCKSGRTTGWTCGRVRKERVHAVSGTTGRRIAAFAHTACSGIGDSGAPVLSGTMAVGILQGGTQGPGGRCRADSGGEDAAVAESLVQDVLPNFPGSLYVLTTTGDQDGDGVPDIDELAADPTAVRDDNGNGVPAFLDPAERAR